MSTSVRSSLSIIALVALAACSGGGSPAATTPRGPAAPSSGATLSTQLIHYIISLGVTRMVVSPASAPLPPAVTDAGPVPGAVVTYPDGSTQVADANGAFTPDRAPYAQRNEDVLETNSDAQPGIKIQDPAARAGAIAATIPAFGAISSGAVLAGVRTLPSAAELFAGETLLVSVEAVDTADRAAAFGNATIAWNATSGSIVPIPGTGAALYTAPATGSPILDTVTATVSAPGAAISLVSTTAVRALPKSSAFTYRGILATANGAPLPKNVALFTQENTPRAYGSYNFFGTADATGAYAAAVAPNTDYVASIGAAGSSSPNGFFATGQTFTSAGAGGTATANLTVNGANSLLDDTKDEARSAIAPPVASVRDAWAAGSIASMATPWAADSGLQNLLASPPTSPTPASSNALASGLFTNWCYQWTNAAAPTLVVIENGDATCTSPGNLAFAIVPGPAGSFAFRRYTLPSGAYALRTPLDATSNNAARLVTAGSWTQALGASGDVAQVRVDSYGPLSPTFGSPIASETFRYAYNPNGTSSTVTIDNDQTTDVPTGRVVSAASVSGRQRAALDASAGGCFAAAAPTPCYEATANVSRTIATSVGPVTRSLAASSITGGDGSEVRSVRASGGATVELPIASRASRVAGNCLVCASGSGRFEDVDGLTQLAGLTVDGGGVVRLTLLDTAEGATAGAPFALLVFGT